MRFLTIGFCKAPRLKPWEYDAVYKKYGNKCYICEIELTVYTRSVDHIHPKKWNGTNDMANLRPCCRKCNKSKDSMTIYEFQKTLVDDVLDSFVKGVRIPMGNLQS